VATTRACPECSASIEVNEGYPDWCEDCDWNLEAPKPHEWGYGRRFDVLVARAGRRSGERISRRLIAARDLRPHWTAPRIAAYAIAVAVFAAGAAGMLGAVALVVIEGPNVVVLFVAAVLFGVGWVLRPRLGKVDREHELGPAEAPELRALARDVAAALHAKPPDVVVVEPEFNAAWAVLGWRRRRVLMLGTGLLAVLDPPELVALMAHELGHERNGDLRDGMVVGGAVNALAELYALMAPAGGPLRGADAFIEAARPLAELLQKLVSLPLFGLLALEATLLLGDLRRAEFLADERAAHVAGTAVVIRLHERLLAHSAYDLALQRAAHQPAATGLFARLREAIESVPGREQ
jgi:Zn-dependent protease with chaperone function